MPDQTLAQRIKAKYPGVYDDLSDTDLESKVKAKYPGVYDDLPTTAAKPTAAPESPSWLSSAMDFGSGVLSQVNPVEILKGIYGAVTSPIETAKGLGSAQLEQFKKGKELYDQGRYTEALGHTLAGALPLVGPAAANIGEDIGAGNVAHGLGAATGLLGTIVAPGAAKPLVKGAQATGAAEAVAGMAEKGIVPKMVDVIAPKVGPNKTRFGNMAKDVAPRLASEPGMGALSRAGLTEKVGAKLSDAEAILDEAHDNRLKGGRILTAPVVRDLEAEKAKWTAQAVPAQEVPEYVNIAAPGEKPLPVVSKDRPTAPLGTDVVPAPNQARVAAINKAIAEVKSLGPMASYDALRTIRASWDQAAKVKYAPSITADFLAKQGEASGAADVTGVIRDVLAKESPETAAANKEYAYWRKANDVLQATAEVERTRPTVGRKIMNRLGGTLVGGALGGTLGEVLGYTLGSSIDAVASGASQGSKILMSRALSDLSSALRSGDAAGVETALKKARAAGLVANASKKDNQ